MVIIGRRGKYKGETPKISHEELVNRAFTYLRVLGCTVVFKERKAATTEEPDAMGFGGSTGSVVIECKTSKSDFFADKKKSFRGHPEQGMGYKRFYMTPVGLLEPSEMPDGWGLLEVYEKPPMLRNRTVKIAKDSNRFFERNCEKEVTYLVSAIRRINISMAVFVEPPSDSKPDQLVGKHAWEKIWAEFDKWHDKNPTICQADQRKKIEELLKEKDEQSKQS